MLDCGCASFEVPTGTNPVVAPQDEEGLKMPSRMTLILRCAARRLEGRGARLQHE
jgi:hypothetical protein